MGLPPRSDTVPASTIRKAGRKLFDTVLLPAADADSDALKNPTKLLSLGEIAARIAVYYNTMDIPLTIFAPDVHHTARLGLDGPPNKLAFKDLPYEFVNCTTAKPERRHDGRVR